MKDTLKDKINERLRYLKHSDEQIGFIDERYNSMLNHADVSIKRYVSTGKSIEEFKKLISSLIKFPDEIIHNWLVDELYTRYEDLLKERIMQLQDMHENLLKTKSLEIK